jgi:hypothetical protein
MHVDFGRRRTNDSCAARGSRRRGSSWNRFRLRTRAVRSDVQSVVSLQESAGPPPSASSGSLTTILAVPSSLGTRRLVAAPPRCSYRGSSLAGKRRALARRPGRLALPVFHASSASVGCGSPDRTRAVRARWLCSSSLRSGVQPIHPPPGSRGGPVPTSSQAIVPRGYARLHRRPSRLRRLLVRKFRRGV